MTTSRELLELAAKACGIDLHPSGIENSWRRGTEGLLLSDGSTVWNPATDQADSDRMACQLEIDTEFYTGCVVCGQATRSGCLRSADHDNTLESKCAAVRQARLLVAAEIGRAK